MLLPIPAQASSPIQIISCNFDAGDKRQSDYNMTVGVTFENVGSQVVTAVKFDFILLDSFGSTLSTQHGVIAGTFSPGVVIKPRYLIDGSLWLHNQLVTSPGWYIRNTFGRDFDSLRCEPSQVRFADGTVQ